MSATEEGVTTRCPNCPTTLVEMQVRTALWQRERLVVVEEIPALVCPACSEQFYDDDTSEALRRLNEEGFPEEAAARTVTVPIFSLAGRIRTRQPIPEDTYVD